METSFHESQSSPVTLYMFTRPFTSLAMAGDALEPGDSEYRIGRLSCVKTCMIFSEDSELASNSLIKNVYALNLLYISSRVFSEEKKGRINVCSIYTYLRNITYLG